MLRNVSRVCVSIYMCIHTYKYTCMGANVPYNVISTDPGRHDGLNVSQRKKLIYLVFVAAASHCPCEKNRKRDGSPHHAIAYIGSEPGLIVIITCARNCNYYRAGYE